MVSLSFAYPKISLPRKSISSSGWASPCECNAVVGRTVTLDELFEQGFDAVYVGVGAGLPRFMNIPGENLVGILSANEYLTRANLMKAYKFPEVDTPIPVGKQVVVLGAGNVAMDAARTAQRLGADNVKIVYRRSREEMPARAAEIHHAEEEGIELFLLTNPTRYSGNEKGRLTGMTCLKMELGEPDASGRRRPIPVEGSQFEIACDLCIVAVGSGANPLLTRETPDMQLNQWGYVVADEKTGKTTKKGVWAGGDIVTGAATVILAMGAGRKAADSMHDYLTLGW
jgi:glutamate synthase (NADPH/NADH) small chain